ncbi:MAG: proton-conducting transporter membrane subunit [Actinobacteria bacterium]|nr:proton-conducting transporter membrane subunit [Actinomycetota bacterium]
MIVLVLLHAVVAVAVLTATRARPVVGAVLGCLVLAATAITVIVLGIGPTTARSESWEWVPDLGLRLAFRLDGFAVAMALVVSVIGVLVLAYSIAYFDQDATYVRFVGLFVAFAGAMTGLVMAADLFTMFVFWELTSVCSFLLIGLNDRSAAARSAALRALLVTGAGGLCLLGGVVLLQVASGTTDFATLASSPPEGAMVTTAACLALVGAFTKSAQFPFHFWLPGAMAAPTPVSAYLHSATMVKAGIVLMARLAPAFGELDVWRWAVVVCGGTTMLLGGARAMRQTDAKLLLAHSTVSQLGFLTLLVGLGVPGATYAGVAHLVAHAVFKAGLFLGVGVVDHATGTRDIRRLSGLAREMPVVAICTGLSAASMAGLIPLFGFATKEKALVALLDADVGAAGVVALVAVVVGAVLSAAYSVRLVRGLFGTKAVAADGGDHAHVHHGSGVLLVGPVASFAAVSLVAGVGAGVVGRWLVGPATSLDAAASSSLYLWPGFNTALAISLSVVVVGAVVGWRVPASVAPTMTKVSGERIFQRLFDGLLDGSKRLTVITQSGSLVAYLGVVMAVVTAVLVAGIAKDPGAGIDELRWADSWVQAAIAMIAIVFAGAVIVARDRFVSALLIGGVGFSCAVLFALYGAPDLALTQILVETLTIVVFLLVLRQMPRRFSPDPVWAPRAVRLAISVGVGGAVAAFAVMVSAARRAPSVGGTYAELSLPEAGGSNIVNVILVDFRGVDTLGEITVLAIAALGVTNLVRMARRARSRALDAAVPASPIAPIAPVEGSDA